MLYIILFVKGCLLGLTAVIPGVSVGTMALVLEVYEKGVQYTVDLLRLRKLQSLQHWMSALLFLLPLLLGGLISMFVASRLLAAFFDNYDVFLRFVFFGIICGSIPYLLKNHIVPLYRSSTWIWFCVYFALGLAFIYFLSDTSERGTQNTAVVFSFAQALRALFFGAVSASVGVVPGISGSYMLILMGYYESFLYIMGTPQIPLLGFFFFGSFLGLTSVAVLVNFLFTKFPAVCYAVVLGIVVGSLARVISVEDIVRFSIREFLIAFVCMFFGVFFITIVSAFQVERP